MKKLKLFISLWFTMFSMVVFGQAEYEKIAITQNTQDNTAGRLLVQDVTTGEVRWILKSILDNKFNQPTGNATQYLDGAGTPTTFPVLSQSDRVITEVRNSTGATITKGTVVYLNGATGGKPNIQKAQANAEATSSGTFGVIQSDINNNSNGYVVVIGTVLGLNTSAYTAGQVLWLSPTTAGGFTTTKPVAPNHAVYVGIVTLAATQGTIEVKIQNGYELDEIHDVLITSKTDNDGLIYESASGLWKNKQITKAMVGLANVDNTSDLNKPISTATQTALNLKENTANKNTANGYAGLGSDGKLISSQLPAITITDTFVVGSQAAMLALTAETGDVAVRTDVNKSFILKGISAGTLADWQELLTPTSSVTSVFGRQGAVTANSGDYTADQISETASRKFQTLAQQTYNDATSSIQTQLNGKVSLSATETIGGVKTFSNMPILSAASGVNGQIVYADASNQLKTTTNFKYNDATGVVTTLLGNLGSNAYTSTAYQPLLTNPITGTGTTGKIPLFTSSTALGDSSLTEFSTYLNLTKPLTIAYSTATSASGLNLSLNNAGSTGTTLYVFNAGSGNLAQFQKSDNTAAFLINSSGNVGIGNASPVYRFQVDRNGTGVIAAFSNQNDADLNINLTSGVSLITPSTGILAFGTSNTERMRITSGGNVGIGTTSPSVAKIQVKGDNGSYAAYFYNNNNASGQTNGLLVEGGTNSSDNALIVNSSVGVAYFKVRGDGNVIVNNLGTGLVYSNGGTLTSTNPSDSRLKDNIVSLNYGLNEILKLRPVSYNWKDDKINQGKQFGFIAQEVQEVMPELVKEFKTEEGNRLGLDKEGIYAALVNAIKEQQAQIKELKAELELLKNK